MFRIEKTNLDAYSSDKKTKYISFDKPIETGVLAAHTNQSKANQRLQKASKANITLVDWDK